jgi:predicted adenylyl cyclase CyaB
MATNIEIKARIQDFDNLKGRAERLSETPGTLIPQEDTFFHTPRGRLKLRVLAPDHGQLVYYERQDGTGPRRSDYYIYSTSNPAVLKEVLTMALGVRGVVRKQRLLYWVGNTRVHLDQVEALGSFLELEVVLEPGQTDEEGQAIATELMAKLGVEEEDLIEVAYMDLLESVTR